MKRIAFDLIMGAGIVAAVYLYVLAFIVLGYLL